MSDAAPTELAARGTALSLALGFETLVDRPTATMRAPFRADLVGDPAEGGLAGGVIFALLDQTCGMAISLALRGRAEGEGRELQMGGMATLDFRLDHIRPPRAGAAVTAEAQCLSLAGDVAVVRGWAYEDDGADPIAAAQAAFMITHLPPEQLAEARLAWERASGVRP
jgi:acyl-coenzyme A thioesterase PaaI-like protein